MLAPPVTLAVVADRMSVVKTSTQYITINQYQFKTSTQEITITCTNSIKVPSYMAKNAYFGTDTGNFSTGTTMYGRI